MQSKKNINILSICRNTSSPSGSSMNKSNENNQENSIESTKNRPFDKSSNYCDDSDPTDWNPTGDPNYNPYSEEENEPWNPYSDEHESD